MVEVGGGGGKKRGRKGEKETYIKYRAIKADESSYLSNSPGR